MENTLADRVKETVTILKKLQEVGIAPTEPGYVQVKNHMDDWIKNGGRHTHEIHFPRYGRVGELVLPSRAGRTATLSLKMVAGETT
jgi:hypothetical protein